MEPELLAKAQDKYLRGKLQWYMRSSLFPYPIPPSAMRAVTPTNEKGSLCSPCADDKFHDKGKEGSEIVYQFTDENAESENNTVYVKGEPIITTGSDVSRFLVDVRDDGDPPLTFRSLFIGTVFACLGATMCQVSLFALHNV